MSNLSNVRAALVAALVPLPGVWPSEVVPAAIGTGSAWVILGNLDAAGAPRAYGVNWIIRVCTGGTPDDHAVWLDKNLDAIAEAISPISYVTTVVPVIIASPNAGDLYGVDFRTYREA